MLDSKVKVFHESILCFMNWPWNCISWNPLKGKFHSVSFPLQLKKHRNSRPEVFCKKDVFSQVCNSITKDTLALLFSYEFWESFENTFSYRKPPVAASESNNFSLKLFSCKVFQGSLHKLFHKSTAIVKMIIKSINIYHKSPVFVKVSRLCYNT